MAPSQPIEPAYYPQFRCLGADCPDTCCEGWEINVDKTTFDNYQSCTDSLLHEQFQRLVKINETPTERNYAGIKFIGPQCPFLDHKLCSIQKKLGEDYLSHTCATFPRNAHQSFGREERSLHLSCPEAARLALTSKQPIRFNFQDDDSRWQGRGLILEILQNRLLRIPQRLALVARLCDLLTAFGRERSEAEISQFLRQFADSMPSELFLSELGLPQPDPALQLTVILELVNARIRLAFVSQRYLDLYREFANGIQMEPSSTWDGVVGRYADARRHHFAPFFDSHIHLFENYLVYSVFRSALPFASSSRHTGADRQLTATEQYLLIATYYAVTRATMIGIAGKLTSAFGITRALECFQLNAKALEHCLSYPQEVLKVLAGHGITQAAQMAVMIDD